MASAGNLFNGECILMMMSFRLTIVMVVMLNIKVSPITCYPIRFKTSIYLFRSFTHNLHVWWCTHNTFGSWVL